MVCGDERVQHGSVGVRVMKEFKCVDIGWRERMYDR